MVMPSPPPRRRRFLKIAFLASLLVPLAVYAALPTVAAAIVTRLLRQQGLQHVTVRFGYPGWRTLRVPLLSFQQDGASASLAVTLRDSRLEYEIGTLFSGWIDRLLVPQASVSWRVRSGSEGQPCPQAQPAGSGPVAGVTVGSLMRLVPQLPVRTLVVEQAHVWRECATGPLRDVVLSGTLHQAGAAAEGSVVLRGQEGAAYRLRFAMLPAGQMDVTLHAEPAASSPIAAVQSHVRQEAAGLRLWGRATADVAQLAPLLALVMPLGADLQRVAGSLQAEWHGTAPATATLATAWHDPAAVISGTAALTLTLPQLAGVGDNLSVQLYGTVTGNAAHLTWTLAPGTRLEVDLERPALPPPGTLPWLVPPRERRVVITCPESVQGQVRLTTRPLQFTVEGPIRMTYGTPQAPLQMEVAVLRAAGQGTAHFTAEATYRLWGATDRIPADVLAVHAAQWDLRGTLVLDHTQLRGTLAASSFMQLHDVRQAAVQVPTGTVRFAEPLPFSVDLVTSRWMAGPAQLQVQTPQVVWQDTSIAMDHASLTLRRLQGNRQHWQTAGVLHLTDVSVQLPAAQLPVMQWHADFTLDAAALRLEVQGTALDEAITLDGRLDYLFASGAGAAQLHLRPIVFDQARRSWKKLLAPWALPIEVTGGRLAATASLTWQPDTAGLAWGAVRPTGSATLTLEQLSGQYQNVLVQGLTTALQFHMTGADAMLLSAPATVTIAALQTGVEVTDVSLQWQLGLAHPLPRSWIELRNVSASMLGGRVMSEGLRFEVGRPEHTLLVKVEHLDIQQLLQVEQQQGVEGTGLLDGVIPIRLTPAGVQVQDGWLEARPPGGSLRYQSAPDAAQERVSSDASLQLVLQALSNFHYNVLQLGVQYTEEGTLKLTARLEGKNPDWQQGRPIHFNLTVAENIPALLKSLRLVRGMQHTIEEHFEKR